jgi:hypothetical protein
VDAQRPELPATAQAGAWAALCLHVSLALLLAAPLDCLVAKGCKRAHALSVGIFDVVAVTGHVPDLKQEG